MENSMIWGDEDLGKKSRRDEGIGVHGQHLWLLMLEPKKSSDIRFESSIKD